MAATRRNTLIGLAAGLGTIALPARSFAQQADTLKIGVLTALTGPQAPYSGAGTVMGATLAAEHFQKLNPNIGVELTSYDIQFNANIVVSLTRELLDSKGYDVILDVPMSAGALAVAPMVAERDKVAMFTSAGASQLTGEACNTNHVHWTHDSYALCRSVVAAHMKDGPKTWFFITADNAFGQGLESDATKFIKAAGGSVIGSVKHPYPGNTEFSTYLLQAQASGADIIGLATVGTDVVNCIKQAAEFGVSGGKQKVAGLWIDLFVVQSLGLKAGQGILTTEAFYWNMSDRARQFATEFKARHGAVPHSQQAGAYSAVWQYLNTAKAIGVPNAKKSGRAVINAMKAAGTMDDPIFNTISVRADGRSINPMAVVEVKKPSESTSPDDVYNVRGFLAGDQVFRPLSEGGCKLVKS